MAQDNLASTKLTTVLLNGRNYIPWSRSATLSLSGRGKLGHITGTKKIPTSVNPASPTDEESQKIKEWQMSDHSVMTWILGSIEPQISQNFMFQKSAHALWEKIKNRYGQQNDFSHIYQLKQDIYHMKQGNKTHTEYVTELQGKIDELNEYLPPTTDPAEVEKRQEHDLIYLYLGGLDPSFDAIRSQILYSTELPTFDAVVAKVQREDTRRMVMNPSSHNQKPSQENQVFISVAPNRDKEKGKGGERCSYCRKEGHSREKCWCLHPHLKPKRREGGGDWRNWDHTDKMKGERKVFGAAQGDEPAEANKNDLVNRVSLGRLTRTKLVPLQHLTRPTSKN